MNFTNYIDGLHYHDMGFSVIPLAAKSKGPPAGFLWKRNQSVRATEGDIRDWFDRSEFNVGIVCGSVSGGLLVRDFDDDDAYRSWTGEQPQLAETLPTVATDRGFHVYCRADDLKTRKVAGGELRGNGAFVVAPGSTHPSGRQYRWIRPIFGELPKVDVTLLSRCPTDRGEHTDTTHMSCVNFSVFSVEEAIQLTIPQRVKTRDECLFQFARHIRALRPNATPEKLAEILRPWHQAALPNISRNSRHRAFDALLADFLHKVKSVRRPAGNAIWAQAVEIAATMPLPACGERYTSDTHRRLVALCCALHQVNGGGSFPLGCRIAGAHLGVSHVIASQVIKRLVLDGVLICTSTKALSRKFAYEYRYIGRAGTSPGGD